jgi:beta-lactamase regulating signal transducer with metallopeptidase domain
VTSLCFHWLLTYLLHSSLLLACAALLDWQRRLTARGMSSPLWRIALFGGFVSATLQPVLQLLFAELRRPAALASLRTLSVDPFAAVALPPLQADAIDIAPLLVPAWLGVAICGFFYLLVRLIRALREIGRMPAVSSGALERDANQLALRARISVPELRIGTQLQAPLVAPGRIICIPAWMLEQCELPRLNAVLAHEMGHLRRHDNEWRIASRIAAIVGWLQPLNRLAIRRLDESAELACDAWAAAATGLNRELACSLEDCAVRLGSSPQNFAFAIGMAATRFTLLERVTNLLENSQMNSRRLQRAAWWSGVALISITAAGSFIVVSTLDDDVPPRWLATNGIYQSLQNSGQNVHTSRSVIIKSPEQYVYIRITENFSFGGQEPAGAGTAIISETRGGVTQSVRYERGTDSEVRRTYKINGRVQPLDAEAEQWLRTMMPIAADGSVRNETVTSPSVL